MKCIQLAYPASYRERVEGEIVEAGSIDWHRHEEPGRAQETVQILLEDGDGQALMDAIQNLFLPDDEWRLMLLDVEATLPRVEELPAEDDASEPEKSPKRAMRETLVEEVMGNSRLNADFITLSILSAIVAAIGLNEDNVAVVIGAMVIAPLLGPILGFSLGSALGSGGMMLKSAKTALSGLAIGFGTVFLLALVWPVNADSAELLARTNINPEVVALALAAGAAAALSLVGGLSSSLVGVMVAVALVPPAAASAMFLGSGDPRSALAAAILVLINVVCVLLSTQVVFVWKGIEPRRWLQQKNAARSRRLNLVVWAVLLIALFGLGAWVGNDGGLAPRLAP